jgi:hypothetical protein
MSIPLFPLAVWSSGTNQNSIPANDNALRLEAKNREIISQAVTAQPASPTDGDTYIIAATHTGAQWSTFSPKDIAIYRGGTWYAWAPVEGLVVNVAGSLFKYDGGVWTSAGGGAGTWGSITGTLSAQTDLQAALDAKAPVGIPQNSQSTAYTLVLGDANKHILHLSADTTARTMTIPANASVAFPVGTAITFVNQNAAGVMTIAITTDTMRLAGPGTTGSRTLAPNGIATALKITPTEWIISGSGLS